MIRRVAIVCVGDSGEAQLLRAALEHLGLDVALNRIGRPTDFFTGFSFFGQPADAAIISTHGDGGGIAFPEMAPGVDDLVLPDDRITPDVLHAQLTGPPPLVVSLACCTGTDAFGAAFHNAGCRAYVASADEPDGRDVALFAHLLFHAMSMRGLEVEPAVVVANAGAGPESVFGSWIMRE